jgi:hypothetical protein
VFRAEEPFADGERFGEERLRFGFPCPAELPRELPKVERATASSCRRLGSVRATTIAE